LRVNLKLGEILIQAGLLTALQLEEALAEKERSKLKLGQIMIRRRYVSEDELIAVLAKQLQVEKFSATDHLFDLAMAEHLPVTVSQKHCIVPLQKKGKLMKLAMIDPTDIAAIDAAEAITNCEVEPIICSEHELQGLTNSLYGQYIDLDGVLESVDDSTILVKTAEHEDTAEDIGMSEVQDIAEDAPVIRLVNSILFQAVKEGVSDIHITPEKSVVLVQFRLDGKLHNIPSPSRAMYLPIAYRIKILAQMDITSSLIPQDGRFTIRVEKKEINIRVSTMPTVHGENIVMRLLDTSTDIYTLEALGMTEYDVTKIRSLIKKPYGMILSTGPTGSGKSTSLYSILKEIYRPDINIITLEDPVEYRVKNIRQAQLNRKAGMTFASGLRSILRQDPDVIMVGEIRDGETAGIAVQAAMTGHLVLSTVHTNNAAGAITRLTNMGVEPFLIASVVLASFAQRLVRRICPYCAEPYIPPKEVLRYWGIDKSDCGGLKKGRGCIQCRGTGYKGRVGIFETLVVDETVQEMILKHRTAREITAATVEKGNIRTLRDDAFDKVLQGLTTFEEAATAVML